MPYIFHITTRAEWKAATAAGAYEAPSLATEGFIHLSEPEQVEPTANRRFRGATNLVLLRVDTDRVSAPLKYEIGEPTTGEEFPHIYGPLNLDAVTEVIPFPDGPYDSILPSW